jgi:hypothetical protein
MTQSNGFNKSAGIAETLRANAVGIALIGAGALWVVAENTGLLDALTQRKDTAFGEHAEQGDGWAAQAGDAAQGAWRTLREGGDAVLERAGRYIEDAGAAGGRVRRAGESLIGRIERDPLTAGLVGLACGAALAALLPPTEGERRLVADARDSLWQRAEELSRRTTDCVRGIGGTPARGSGEFGAHD